MSVKDRKSESAKIQILATTLAAVGILNLIAVTCAVGAVRIKDVGRFAGAEGARLIGYGLVVGLEGTGDSPKSLFTNQALANMLERFGIAVDGSKVRASNVAAVIVTGDVPAFTRSGGRFDVIVSSLGDAKSLQGGVLLQTTLSDLGNSVYAIASGPLSIGGFNIEAGAVSVRQNYAAVGRVPGGGVLEHDLGTKVSSEGGLTYTLRHGDFSTARRLAEAVNTFFSADVARAIDAVSVRLLLPENYADPDSLVPFIAALESIEFEPDQAARVIINERTGTIVIGENVSLSTVAVSHGALSITIKSTPLVSQPQPFSRGETRSDQFQEINIEQRGTGVVVIPGSTTVGDIAAALNRLGVTPRDIIAIFQALKQSGALQAELVII
ncbi:MAG: flagellar basal body P-ring protein FlgI [Calditrichaeota bacterium]|nr:flagellar basal body P-ring protein FlgI [Calditrichota bacterium]